MWLIEEFRYTLKLLKKNLAFSFFCVLIISFGMAISLTLFSIVDNMGYRTIDYPDGERLVVIKLHRSGETIEFSDYFDAPRLRFLQQNSESFAVLGAVKATEYVNVSDGDLPQVVMAARIAPDVLTTTGVNPIMGRGLQPADSEAGAENVALISYSLWQTYYAARTDIVGRRAIIDGESRTIVGVMPEDFGFPLANDLWMPLRLEQSAEPGRAPTDISAVGLLESGISIDQANSELEALSRQYNEFWAENYAQAWITRLRPFTRFQANAPDLLLAMMGIVSVGVLLLVAFNVANLLIYRASERGHELSVRRAVGASPFRCMFSFMQESFLICLTGGLCGLVIARYFLQLVDTTARSELGYQPFWTNYNIDLSLTIVAILAVVLLWICSSLPFTRKVLSGELSVDLNGGSKGGRQRASTKVTSVFVSLEVLFSCFLLIITLSFIFAIYGSLRGEAEFGIDVDKVFVAQLALSSENYASGASKETYYRNFRSELETKAGIEQVEFSTDLPGGGASRVFYGVDDRDLALDAEYPGLFSISVSAGYFAMLGIELIEGRGFIDGLELANSEAVAIIEERLAAYLWPGESAVGKRIVLDPMADAEPVTIVGVVANVEHDFAGVALTTQTSTPALYRPLSQTLPSDFYVVAKSTLGNFNYATVLREAAAAADRNIPLANPKTMGASVLESAQALILLGNIFMMVSLMAILLTSCAIYGVMARATLNRVNETGIRRALGCTDGQIVVMFLKDAFKVVIYGLVAGSLAGILVTQAGIARLIPSTLGTLPLVGISVVALLAGVAVIATLVPSLKVISMEPGAALVYE